MKRLEFGFKAKTQYAHHLIKEDQFEGDISLIRFYDVEEEMIRTAFDQDYKLIADDHFWLQIAPSNGHTWLTVMINPNHEITQYYFDITKINNINEENSSFIDLYLDLLVHPNGRYLILDEDELHEACDQGIISQKEVYEASGYLCDLINSLDTKKMEAFALKHFHQLYSLL